MEKSGRGYHMCSLTQNKNVPYDPLKMYGAGKKKNNKGVKKKTEKPLVEKEADGTIYVSRRHFLRVLKASGHTPISKKELRSKAKAQKKRLEVNSQKALSKTIKPKNDEMGKTKEKTITACPKENRYKIIDYTPFTLKQKRKLDTFIFITKYGLNRSDKRVQELFQKIAFKGIKPSDFEKVAIGQYVIDCRLRIGQIVFVDTETITVKYVKDSVRYNRDNAFQNEYIKPWGLIDGVSYSSDVRVLANKSKYDFMTNICTLYKRFKLDAR